MRKMFNLVNKVKSWFRSRSHQKDESQAHLDIRTQLESCFNAFNFDQYSFEVEELKKDEYYIFYNNVIFAKATYANDTVSIDINMICTPMLAIMISRSLILGMKPNVLFERSFVYQRNNGSIEFFYDLDAVEQIYKNPAKESLVSSDKMTSGLVN
jgi:hypothetical protein